MNTSHGKIAININFVMKNHLTDLSAIQRKVADITGSFLRDRFFNVNVTARIAYVYTQHA